MNDALTAAPAVLAGWPEEPAAAVQVVSADGAPAIDVPAGVQAWLMGATVSVQVGFDLAFERARWEQAARHGRRLLSIRLTADEAAIGPLWVPGAPTACAGCAEVRLRQAAGHPLRARGDVNAGPRSGWPAGLVVLAEVGLSHLGGHPLEPGEMLSVGLSRTRRHRVARSAACPLCAGAPPKAGAPATLTLHPRPSGDPVPLRGRPSPALGGSALLDLLDPRVGPVLQLQRDRRAPFAMTGALVAGARAPGYGRGGDFAHAGRVAILEAYERLGATPQDGRIVRDLTYDEARPVAVDPATLGCHSRAQLDHPHARVMAYRPDVAMDWALGHQLPDGQARLLPADVAFYGYQYPARPGDERRRPHFFAESSSGCALGSSLEEATVHALLELIERDAFLLAWCRRAPLPAISRGSVDDPASRMLLESIEARGFAVHLLATTCDLGLPSVWALGVNRDRHAVPATFSAAGSSPVPAEAVRAALWELAQLVARPPDWDVAAVEPLVDDPSLVDTIEDHVHLYAMPELRDRVTEVLGGEAVTVTSAFPGWPEQLCQAAGGDVRGALDYLLDQCRAAGLDQVLVVDQSTREHHDLGLHVARVVVPGMLPMCFGSPQQRLGGLPRRERARAVVAGADPDADLLSDPHPFP